MRQMHENVDKSRFINKTTFSKDFQPKNRGRPKAGFQSFKDRLAYWMDTKTLKEIKDLVDDPDEKKMNKMVTADVMVLQRIRAACKASGGADFQMVLDRLLGKPAITADLQVTHALADRLDQAEKQLASSSAATIEGTATVLNSIIEDSLEPEPISLPADFSDLI